MNVKREENEMLMVERLKSPKNAESLFIVLPGGGGRVKKESIIQGSSSSAAAAAAVSSVKPREKESARTTYQHQQRSKDRSDEVTIDGQLISTQFPPGTA